MFTQIKTNSIAWPGIFQGTLFKLENERVKRIDFSSCLTRIQSKVARAQRNEHLTAAFRGKTLRAEFQ
jgi:hypothetical protein